VIIRAAEPEAIVAEPIKGVVFDFHATLVDARDPDSWITAAQQLLGVPAKGATVPGTAEFDRLSEHLHRVWDHAVAIDPNAERDLSLARHREVFGQAMSLLPDVDADLIEALYTVMPDQWTAFDDALPVLRELKARGIRTVVLSNTGIDIHDWLRKAGITDVIDGLVLSYEVGVVKPQPEIFQLALEALDVPATAALMVGDSWHADAGAAALGIRTLILPRTFGPVHGLGAVLRLVG